MTYQQWMCQVNHNIGLKLGGLTADDLPDRDTRGMYDSGMDPDEAARSILECECEELGYDYEEMFGD